MNERIDLLAQQATDYKGGLDRHMFAKLIVQDCVAEIAMIGVTNFDNSDIMWTVEKAIENIETRFGLK